MFRLAYLPDYKPVMVGIMAASPDGEGFEALFDSYWFTYLPDSRRQEWLKQSP